MKIITEGHEAENAVLQIMQLFFSPDDGAEVISRVKKEGSLTLASAEITFGAKKSIGEAQTDKSDRLSVTNAVKKSVFYAGRQLSDMPAPWGISTGIRPAKAARKRLDIDTDDEILKHLKEEYLISEKKARLALSVAKKELDILNTMPPDSVSIYVGIPFCPTRCSYCSFISQATEHNKKFVIPYTDSIVREIEHTADIIKKLGMKTDTVYFGGGTPTAIDEKLLEKIILSLQENIDFSHVREFTVEAGRPDTFSIEMMKMLKRRGVGRISINPQTMHQKTLDRVGRHHSTNDVKRAFYLAREAGIESINADLIAGLPGEDTKMMEYTVSELLKLKPDAVTVHTLYMKRAADIIGEFNKLRFTENVASMVDCTASMLQSEGFMPYYMYKQRNTLGNLENVGFAKPGHESLYNVYIMEEVQPILAIGAAGSTKMVFKDEIERIFNPKDAADYISRIQEVLNRKDIFLNFYKERE